MRVMAFFDGNCRLSDRGAGAAIVYDEQGNELARKATYLEGSDMTANIAEYRGLSNALELAHQVGATHVDILGDSELIVRHFNGRYQCRKEHLKPLLDEVLFKASVFQECVVEELPRSGRNGKRRNLNEEADAFATLCMNAGHDLP